MYCDVKTNRKNARWKIGNGSRAERIDENYISRREGGIIFQQCRKIWLMRADFKTVKNTIHRDPEIAFVLLN